MKRHFYAIEDYHYGMGEHYAVELVAGTMGGRGVLLLGKALIHCFTSLKQRNEWVYEAPRVRRTMNSTDIVHIPGERGKQAFRKISDATIYRRH
jgi:hypothetical protein